jgi:hypothetical protein
MPQYKSLYGAEIKDAADEWRGALGDIIPDKPFAGPDYRKAVKTMESDPRIAEKLMVARRGQLLADGLDAITADQQAKKDVLRLRERFGR